jgi:hypothetical protein
VRACCSESVVTGPSTGGATRAATGGGGTGTTNGVGEAIWGGLAAAPIGGGSCLDIACTMPEVIMVRPNKAKVLILWE